MIFVLKHHSTCLSSGTTSIAPGKQQKNSGFSFESELYFAKKRRKTLAGCATTTYMDGLLSVLPIEHLLAG